MSAACGGGTAGPIPPETLESLAPRAAPDPAAPVQDLVRGFNDAGFGLLRDQPPAENSILSPLSVGHALLMLRGAADEVTGSAIDRRFGLPPDDEAHRAWNAVDQSVAGSAEVANGVDGRPTPIIELAGRVWPAHGLSPDQAWLDLLAAEHGAAVETIDVGDPEGSRAHINDWVSERTNALIPQLLPEGFIDETTLLVLTDAVYFRAQWQTIFIKYGPQPGEFHRLDGSTVSTDFLVDLEQPGPRGVGDGWSAASLPYLGGDFSMLVIIPDQGRFEELGAALSTGFVDEVDAGLVTGPFEFWMPMWTTTTNIDLLDWLGAAGIAPGNFPGVSDGSFLAGAVHAADISVDELGTEAAAATGLGVDESGPPDPELVIKADRPFYYVVRHEPTGAILFTGRVVDPTS